MKNIWLSAKIGAAIRKSINFLLLVEFYRMVKAFPLFHPFAFSSRGYSIERSPLTGKYKKKKVAVQPITRWCDFYRGETRWGRCFCSWRFTRIVWYDRRCLTPVVLSVSVFHRGKSWQEHTDDRWVRTVHQILFIRCTHYLLFTGPPYNVLYTFRVIRFPKRKK